MAAKRRRRATKKHQVNMHLQAFDITKAGTSLDLEIFAAGEKLGDLTIGQGSINWRGRNRRSGKRFSWTKFAEMMDELVYGR